jgi:hypothetical protein
MFHATNATVPRVMATTFDDIEAKYGGVQRILNKTAKVTRDHEILPLEAGAGR